MGVCFIFSPCFPDGEDQGQSSNFGRRREKYGGGCGWERARAPARVTDSQRMDEWSRWIANMYNYYKPSSELRSTNKFIQSMLKTIFPIVRLPLSCSKPPFTPFSSKDFTSKWGFVLDFFSRETISSKCGLLFPLVRIIVLWGFILPMTWRAHVDGGPLIWTYSPVFSFNNGIMDGT